MKGREVREALQSDFPPKLVHTIATLAEDNSAMGQEIHAIAELLNQLTDVIGGITETMGEVKKATEVFNIGMK